MLVAAVACLAYRVGALPGGLIGVDVVLVALGAWFGAGGPTPAGLRRRVALGWSMLWPPVLGALVLAIVWVLVEPSTAADPVVRGEALALVGGYLNWHLVLNGPAEVVATRVDLPLQHLWPVAVVAQGLLVWWATIVATGSASRRAPGRRSPAVPIVAALAALAWLIGIGVAVAGASGPVVLVATPSRLAALLAGVALGALDGGVGSTVVEVLRAGRVGVVAILAVLAVVASPGEPVGRWSFVALVPLLAVLLIASTPAPAQPAMIDRADVALWPWPTVVAAWVLAPAAVSVVAAALPGAPSAVVGVLGLLLGAVAAALTVVTWAAASDEPAAVERRRTLAPPIAVGLVVLLASVTGAFHWEGPQSRWEWEAEHGGGS